MPIEFNGEQLAELVDYFYKIVYDIVDEANYDRASFSISEIKLGRALHEFKTDLDFLQKRRRIPSGKNPRGISPGKLAGVQLFRLIRNNPVHVEKSLVEDPVAVDLGFAASYSYVLKHVLECNASTIPPSISKELQYNLLHRHANQETLGMVFDFLDLYGSCSKMQQNNATV